VEFLATRLSRYEIPTDIAIVDTIPRTPSGKADLGAVRQHFAEMVSAARGTHGI
jgi:acyl-CoA synthetase (AMP-forming)/AMP-acid ligase II